LVVLAVAALSLVAPATAARIVAVGDLHGDYEAYWTILSEAGLIDARGKWSGGETILVQTGDVADRGPDTLKIIRHLMKLEKDAKRKGGRVVALIGNHEAMNMTGDLRYVTPEEFAAFRTRRSAAVRAAYFMDHRDALRARYEGAFSDDALREKFEAEVPLGYIEHRLAWRPKGEIGKWILKHDAIAALDGTVFVHGGISRAYAATPISAINERVRAALAGAADPILTDEQGPLWYRGNAEETEAGAAEIAEVLGALGADRLAIGHTPSLGGVRELYAGKVIVIDTGASKAFGGVRSWIEIDGGAVTAHRANGEED
jgi:hypothetical protein